MPNIITNKITDKKYATTKKKWKKGYSCITEKRVISKNANSFCVCGTSYTRNLILFSFFFLL